MFVVVDEVAMRRVLRCVDLMDLNVQAVGGIITIDDTTRERTQPSK
jgi:hypothetical protein